MDSGHKDFQILDALRQEIFRLAGGEPALTEVFPALVQSAMEFVLDPVATGRTRLTLLDNVEKTFIGLKVEHFLRDFLDVPKGIRDLKIGGVDVDVKNTVRGNWMIPPETYNASDPCVLVSYDDESQKCFLGLFLARLEYLNAENRDKKRSLSQMGRNQILWLVDGAKFPDSHWREFDMERFRELRKMRGGTKRASQFFRENIRKRVHRRVIQSLLYDQDDYMKRVRGNGGARDVLRKEGVAILSGNYDARLLELVGVDGAHADELIAVAAFNPEEETLLRQHGKID